MTIQQIFVLSDGEEIPLSIISRSGMSNITIRPKINPKREIVIGVPRFVRMTQAMKFLETKREWVEKMCIRDRILRNYENNK